MKKYLQTLLLLLMCFIGTPIIQALKLDIESKNVILYNLDENKVLYEKDSTEQISIASMTKIMTAIVAIENIKNLDEKVKLTSADFYGLAEANASVAGFKVGEVVTYRDLLYGLLLPSGADAALTLTRTVAGGRDNFIKLMNQKAENLGLHNTHFANETGLDENNHYSTVEEVAKLFQYALQNKDFKKIITSSTYKTSDDLLTFKSTIAKNVARYGLDMDYVLGGKTGSTFDAGLCLASIAEYENVHYLLVTARAPYGGKPYHILDAKTIYEYFMNHFSNQPVLEQEDIILTLQTKYAKEENVSFTSQKTIWKYVTNEFEKTDLTFTYDGVMEIDPFMKKGTKLGTLTITYDGEILTTKDIILTETVSLDIFKYIMAHKIQTGIIIAFSIFIITLVTRLIKRKKKNVFPLKRHL